MVTGVVVLVVSLLALVVSLPPFFASFRILSFNLFMYFSLHLRPASTRFASFVITSDVHVYFKQKGKKLTKNDLQHCH